MRAGNGPEFDHRIPCAEGGDNSLENCDVLCRNCHGAKTKKDVPRIAKGKRIRDKADNIRARQWRPMIGTKASGIRKPMNGQVEKW
jgi:5-methylcytosine-specific restriction protein A